MLKHTLTQLRARSYASWQTPGSTAIRVSSLVLDSIYTDAMDGLNAVPAPVADIGGALFGSRSENEIVIDDFEPIPFEYGLGNSFRLSDGDRLRLREMLQRFRQHENLSILGWYRSKSCQDLALNEGDRELLETELCHSAVILLIRPSKFQPYEVKLYLGGEEQLQQAQQTTYFAFDTRTSSLLRPPGTDPPAVAAPTLRTGAALSRIEPLSNPDNPSKSFEPGNTVHEIHSAASVMRQEHHATSVAATAAREPEVVVPTPTAEPHASHLIPSEHDGTTASVSPEVERKCIGETRVPITKGPERQPALERIAPLARRRLLAAHPPEERERRKRSFVIGALLFAAIGGMLGYYSLQQRPADRQSTLRRGPAPASAVANQVIPAPQPAHTSLAQGLATDSPVLPQKVAENDAVLVDADPQIPLFLYKWANAEKGTKIGELTDLYAPKLSRYFTKRDVTRAGVRAVRARNEARYGRMIMCEIKDIKVKLLDTGHAIATFRKQWQTAGPRVLITEEQDELTLIRDQGKWQIASEKRIKLYGVRKEYYAPASRRTRLGLRRSQARRSSRRK